MIDLRSDTVTLPSKEMKEHMLAAPLGDDVYGEDPSIYKLEILASQMFGKEAALFVPSGTMANLISVLTHCSRGDEVMLGNKSHIFYYEAGGISAFGGVHSHQLSNNIDGTINIENIINSIRDKEDAHFPLTKLLCLENTHNTCNGNPINSEYFKLVSETINIHKIKLHIDGARIFNASVALNESLKSLTQYSDTVSCCLSKGLGCPAGSLILGSKKDIKIAYRIRKALGGGMRQAGILASAGIYALTNMIDRISIDHENAKKMALELKNIHGIKINCDLVKTNIIFFYLDSVNLNEEEFIKKLHLNKIKIDSKGNRKFRIVTHCNFNSNDIDKVINTIKLILK